MDVMQAIGVQRSIRARTRENTEKPGAVPASMEGRFEAASGHQATKEKHVPSCCEGSVNKLSDFCEY